MAELSPGLWLLELWCEMQGNVRVGWRICSVQAGAYTGVVMGNWVTTGVVLNSPLLL